MHALFRAFLPLALALSGTCHAAPYLYIPQQASTQLAILDLNSTRPGYPKVLVDAKVDLLAQGLAVLPHPGGRWVFVITGSGVQKLDANNNHQAVGSMLAIAGLHTSKRNPALLSRDGRQLFIAGADNNSLHSIDTASMSELKSVPLPLPPTALLHWPESNRLYVGYSSGDKLAVLDDATLASSGEIALEDASGVSDLQAVRSTNNDSLYVSLVSNKLRAIELRNAAHTVVQNNAPGMPAACSNMSYSENGRLYFNCALQKEIWQIDAALGSFASNKASKTAALLSTPGALSLFSVNSSNHKLYISYPGLPKVSLLDLNSNPVELKDAANDPLLKTDAVDSLLVQPKFQFNASDYSGLKHGGAITLTVQRNGFLNESAAKVSYDAKEGLGVLKNINYTFDAGQLEFAPSEREKTFIVTPIPLDVVEKDKFLTVQLSSPSDGEGLGNQDSARVTLINDVDKPGFFKASGCSIGGGQPDPTLPLLTGIAVLYLWKRRKAV